jgi:ABC-2 type transport system ATP-binding protein
MADVTRRFNGTQAVAGLDLEIPSGEIVGVIGPSGSGKTTTIRMMTGSLAPTAGTVEVLGERPDRFHRRTRERLGYMPQLFSLYPDLSVGENVDLAAALYGLLLWRRWRRCRAVLQLLDLWDVRRRRASQLSGGMKRRLELAAAMVHEPDLLILDEPTAGIDPLLRRTVWDEIHRLRDGGVTAIVTTQYVTEAEECDRVALLSDGRLIAFDTPDQLRRQALGGEVVEVTMQGLFDASTLERSPGVLGVRQTGPRTFQLIVEDAGTATADAVQKMSAAGADVASVRELHPTFEEVFTTLVERARSVDAEEGAAATDTAAPSAREQGPPAEPRPTEPRNVEAPKAEGAAEEPPPPTGGTA